ncbi:Fic family protein [Pseudothauera rhizosphaerae]|uniref:Fic family protein n=1 Tax=Pseudothauera rhizosphaerae TaxID=2565932 RepID=UPI001E32BB5F|nr:Fic family protein [Pseudothauera rhizosphaerae]
MEITPGKPLGEFTVSPQSGWRRIGREMVPGEIALIEGGSALVASTTACDDATHDTPTDSPDRSATQGMARSPRGRGQPARRLSGEGAGVHAELDGAGERTGGPGTGTGMADSTQPLDATRALASSEGVLTYTEVSERLAAKVADCIDELLDAEPAAMEFSADWLRDVHRRVAGDLFPDWAGRFRTTAVQVGTHTPPSAHDVPVRVRDFCLDLEERLRHVDNAESIAELFIRLGRLAVPVDSSVQGFQWPGWAHSAGRVGLQIGIAAHGSRRQRKKEAEVF